MKLTILVTLFVFNKITYQQNVNDLIAQYQNGGGNMKAAFDPKSIKLPSLNPDSIQQLRGYAEKRAAEQYDFNNILQRQLQSGNQELQNEIQNSPFFQNQASNLNLSNINQQNQQQLQNLVLNNSSQINAQFQQQYQQQQFNSLQNQPNQINQAINDQSQLTQEQKNQLLSNPQFLGTLQQMLQQQQQQQPQQQQPNQNNQQQNKQQTNQTGGQNQQLVNLFDNSSQQKNNQDRILLGETNQLKEVSRSIKGDTSLAAYLHLLSSFEKNRFVTESGNTVDNCEILQRISPINQQREQLKQCRAIHFHGIGNDEICFIFACMTLNQDVMFYRICLNAIPLEQQLLNLNNTTSDNRRFDKDYSPNRFQRDSEFSLNDPIDCKNGKTIIRDESLIDIK